jgi:hypothetical protein
MSENLSKLYWAAMERARIATFGFIVPDTPPPRLADLQKTKRRNLRRKMKKRVAKVQHK